MASVGLGCLLATCLVFLIGSWLDYASGSTIGPTTGCASCSYRTLAFARGLDSALGFGPASTGISATSEVGWVASVGGGVAGARS